jgi:cytoskeletal protein CcmA (bactofilin family)
MSIFTKSAETSGNPSEPVRRETSPPRLSSASESAGEVSIVGRGVQIDGDIKVTGDVRVGGRINGSVTVEDRLVLASEGVIMGNVESGEADIAGSVEGDVHATGRLTVRATASIVGGIIAEHLVVEDGAAITGTCKVGKPARVEKSSKGVGDGAPEGSKGLLPLDSAGGASGS